MSPILSRNQGPEAFRLCTEPSFLEGMARVLDLAASLQQYNTSETAAAADLRAIASDWIVTGRDIATAIHTYPHVGGTIEERVAA